MANRDPREIRAEIDRTRSEISATVDEIEERLDPARLKAEAQEAVRDATIGRVERMADTASNRVSNFTSGVVDTVKQNPVPAALIGIGVGWLLMERDSSRNRAIDAQYRWREGQYQAQGQMQRTAGEAQGKVQHIAGEAQEKAGQLAGEARSRVEEVGQQAVHQAEELRDQAVEQAEYVLDEAQYRVERAGSWFQKSMRDNPLAVGAAAVALGAMIGMALPSTRQENQIMGETRDKVVDRARQMAEDTAGRVQHVAERAQEAATETAKEEARKQNLAG